MENKVPHEALGFNTRSYKLHGLSGRDRGGALRLLQLLRHPDLLGWVFSGRPTHNGRGRAGSLWGPRSGPASFLLMQGT